MARPPKRIAPDIIEREILRREAEEMSASFRKFVEAAWPIVEPGATFIGGYHVDAIAEHLQAVAERKISKIVVNIQPRAGKTTLISVLWPAWLWTRRPEEQILSASYGLDLARTATIAARRVIESDWYKARWPDVVLSDDQNRVTAYENTRQGKRQTTSVGGAVTGLGGNVLILDDPHNAQFAESKVQRENAIEWYKNSWATRKNPNPAFPPVYVTVMQRLHEGDLAGHLLAEGGWEHLILPTEYEGNKNRTSIGWEDPRTEIGEVLWPAIQGTPAGRKELEQFKKTLGSYGVAGQLQQRPAPRGGGFLKAEWMCFWYDPDEGEPDPVSVQLSDGSYWDCPQKPRPRIQLDGLTHSWDLAFKGDQTSDYVVGQVWGIGYDDPANRYLLAQERGQWDFPETKEAIRRMRRNYAANAILVEEKANGSGIISELKNEIAGIVPVDPEGDKNSRCHSVAPHFEAKNVWLPHPAQFEWVQDYVDELTVFPRGKNDDQVDATTQALRRMADSEFILIDMASSIANPAENEWIP